MALQASDTLLVDCQLAFNTPYNLVGMAIRFTRLANPGLYALSSGTQGTSVFIGSLELLLHLLYLLRLLLFRYLAAFPGGTQAAPLQGIPGQQDLLQLAIQLPGLDRAAGLLC